jgi:hypothetical protein
VGVGCRRGASYPASREGSRPLALAPTGIRGGWRKLGRPGGTFHISAWQPCAVRQTAAPSESRTLRGVSVSATRGPGTGVLHQSSELTGFSTVADAADGRAGAVGLCERFFVPQPCTTEVPLQMDTNAVSGIPCDVL